MCGVRLFEAAAFKDEVNERLSRDVIQFKEDMIQVASGLSLNRIKKIKDMMNQSLPHYGAIKNPFGSDFDNIILVMKAINWIANIPEDGLSEGFTSLWIYWINTKDGEVEYKALDKFGFIFKPGVQQDVHNEIYQYVVKREKFLKGKVPA